ncbi:hypothetical protein OIU77_005238 [Salix suchowensis]|uniref:Protein TIFY n=1 Tax=Salix suchowensis TaxID=1278906 RepID=A0ABQ9ANP1_9ROSI|nr:hypothetical protein OIU77_005238 [Salix suchowensis]
MAVIMTMVQQSKNSNANSGHSIGVNLNRSTATSQQQQKQEVKAMFHDFLGMKATTDSPVVLAPKNKDGSPSASASLGASSGGGLGPLSSTSDLASERQAGNHLEGIPFYCPRSDISGPEISNRLAGSKRSNSDSAFTGPRDGIPQMAHDSIESLHLMKMLKNAGGGERSRRSNDDEVFYGMQSRRPSSASLTVQPSNGNRLDANVSKWERSIPMGVPELELKALGILSSINAGSGISEKNSSGGLLSGSKPKIGIHVSEPESSTPASQRGLTSASRQMTIFYGGQAHVFDDVHPNKVCFPFVC